MPNKQVSLRVSSCNFYLQLVQVDAHVTKRKNRDKKTAQNATQAEINARPEPLHDDDSFIYGPPLTKPSMPSGLFSYSSAPSFY